MPSDRDPYLIGRAGSYTVPTIGCIDAELVKLSRRLKTGRGHRPALLADADALLDRRRHLSDRKVSS